MKHKILSLLVLLLTVASSAWADWNGGTYTATANETIEGTVTVSANATLTIAAGKTVTINVHNDLVSSGITNINLRIVENVSDTFCRFWKRCVTSYFGHDELSIDSIDSQQSVYAFSGETLHRAELTDCIIFAGCVSTIVIRLS